MLNAYKNPPVISDIKTSSYYFLRQREVSTLHGKFCELDRLLLRDTQTDQL